MTKCQRCRRKRETRLRSLGGQFKSALCGECFARWKETLPLMFTEFMRGALYPKEGKLFLADGGTYGGILR